MLVLVLFIDLTVVSSNFIDNLANLGFSSQMIASHPYKLNPGSLASPIRLVKAHYKAATAGELWLINRVLNFTKQVLRQLDLLDTFLVRYDIYARVRFIFVKFNAFWGEAVWGTRYTKWLYAHLALEWDIYYEFRAEVRLSPQAIISHMILPKISINQCII